MEEKESNEPEDEEPVAFLVASKASVMACRYFERREVKIRGWRWRSAAGRDILSFPGGTEGEERVP